MATRYLTALDYSDWHTSTVLKKHAKRRPLGQIECRFQYTQQQPMLACSTVDSDAHGTGVRARSTYDLMQEQQRVLHQLLAKGGSSQRAASAPTRRSVGRTGAQQPTTNSYGHVTDKGRPSTVSTSSEANRLKSSSSSRRFQHTNRPKTTESFMTVSVDKDMLKTRRVYHDLTHQIHNHWRPGGSKLGQGHFRRGQQRADDVPTSADTWLTFGGTSEDGAVGVVDAFADVAGPDGCYSIVGSVASRVAQQLRKGDKIRIGINGEVRSHDLRQRQKDDQEGEGVEDSTEETLQQEELKDDEDGQKEEEVKEEEEEEEKTVEIARPSSGRENPPSPTSEKERDEFDEMIFSLGSLENLSLADILGDDDTSKPQESQDVNSSPEDSTSKLTTDAPSNPVLDDSVSEAPTKPPETKSAPKHVVNFPLNWEDQVSRPEVKVLSPRPAPLDNNRESLCETHPVVFNKVNRCRHYTRPRLATPNSAPGFRVKQRPVSSSSTSSSHSSATVRNRLDSTAGNKIRALTVDQNSTEEDRRLNSMSVEDIIQTRLDIVSSAASTPTPTPGQRALVSSTGALDSSRSTVSQEGWRASGSTTPRSSSRLHHSLNHTRSVSAAPQSSFARASSDWTARAKSASALKSFTATDRRLGVPRPSSSVPTRGARDSDLSCVTPVVMSRRGGKRTDRSDKGPRHMTGLPPNRGAGSGVSSINAGPIPGDTQFIQISQPIRNPNSGALPAGLPSFYSPFPVNSVVTSPVPPHRTPSRSNTPENMVDCQVVEAGKEKEVRIVSPRSLASTDPVAASSRLGQDTTSAVAVSHTGSVPASVEESSRQALTPAPDGARAVSPVPAINIPTGNEVDDEEEEEVTSSQRKNMAPREQHVTQVSGMLVRAVMGAEQK